MLPLADINEHLLGSGHRGKPQSSNVPALRGFTSDGT